MKRNLLLVVFLIALTTPFTGLRAQDNNDTAVKGDSLEKKKKRVKPVLLTPYHWNTIKFNPTPMLIQAVEIRNITLSYERLIKKNQSLCIQAGYLVFPRILNDTVQGLIFISRGEKWGLNLALEYRYYPSARNRRPAPDGLYLGGYLSYYGFTFRNAFDILHTTIDQNGTIAGNLSAINLGFELGYQFIFWKRLSLDLLLFGPSLSTYRGKLTIEGNLDPEEIKNLDEEMVDKLLNRFPLLGELFSGDRLTFTGTKTSFGIGFKYSIQLGFHF
jgi:hypothetical protein